MMSTPRRSATGTTTDDTHVVPLSALTAADLPTAGGKGANLGEAAAAGFRVPDGFVVTTDAYSAALAQGLDFADVALPEAVRSAIAAAYTAMGEPPVAVRSSATAEDLPGASFAGQQDTFLNVRGVNALLHAVRDCWASLWTERAITYRATRGIDSAEVRIAVVVQTMVDPDLAGVLFTANTVTGARDEIVVEASGGLGEAVVSGLVTPDHYRLAPDGAVLESRHGRREVVIRSAPEGGTTETTENGADTRLPDSALRDLARLGTALAAHFGRPQDVEWAYVDRTIWLLQARPLTALPPAPIRLNRVQRIAGPVIAELFPARPYPMDMSAWVVPGVGRLVDRMLGEIPAVRIDFSDVLPEVDGVVDRFVPPNPRPTLATPFTPVRMWGRIRTFDPARWREDPRFQRYVRDIDALATRDTTALAWDTLCRQPREALAHLDVMTDTRVDYLPRCGYDLLRLRLALRRLRATHLFGGLVAGGRTETQDANNALEEIADQVRADPDLRKLFADHDATTIAARLRSGQYAELRATLEKFLATYGHRETLSLLFVSAPTWAEAWETPIGAIQALTGGEAAPRRGDASEDALTQLMAHPSVRRNPRLRDRLHRQVAAARAGTAFREDTHFEISRAIPAVRRAVLEIGRRLAAASVLRHRGDIWHLRLSEVQDLPEDVPEEERARLRSLVRERQARRAELTGAPLIAPTTLFPDRRITEDALTAGTPGGGGRGTGTVRIVRNPEEFGRLTMGDVLVCPTTNPAWTPLFRTAAAVVVDTGGPGSHAAIVARESGIPAVLGTGTGTTALTDGQRVTVDGDLGVVRAAED